MTPKMPKDVAAVFDALPKDAKASILQVREVIFKAAEDSQIGALVETLKWGEISYLPKAKRTGTTIRISASPDGSDMRMFVPCQTKLLDIYRERFPDDFEYIGNREIHVTADDLDNPALLQLAALALTYHRDKLGER